MTMQQALSALITKIENNFLWLKNNKQNTLVSGTNIKTVNNQPLLGSGNISISTGGTATDVQINGTSITNNNVANLLTNSAYNSSSNKIATMNDLPTVPTKVSDLTNDAGYLTSHQDISGKVNISDIASSVSASSTNSVPVGAKLFYDTVGNIETLLSQV